MGKRVFRKAVARSTGNSHTKASPAGGFPKQAGVVERSKCVRTEGRRGGDARCKKKPKGRVPGTAAVAHRSSATGSSRTTQETGFVASKRKKCVCSSAAAARDAGNHGCSTTARALLSSSCSSGQGNVPTSTSVSAGRVSRAVRFRSRRARGNCVRSTDAQRSSPSTCRIISCPACSKL